MRQDRKRLSRNVPLHPAVRHLNNTKDDNRLVNLKWGTRAENLQQCFVEGRSHKGKLSVAQVKEIRESDLSCTALAAKYGMCKSNMHKIKSGKYWSYVT